MERKRVTFQVEAAKCLQCSQESSGENSRGSGPFLKEAVGYCKTCKQFLCSTCLKTHRRLVVSENHKILNRDHVVSGESLYESKKTETGSTNANLHQEVLDPMSDPEAYYKTYKYKLSIGLAGDSSAKLTPKATHINKLGVKQQKSPMEDKTNEPTYDFSETCKYHGGETIKHFCEFHRQLCCDICKIREHGICKGFLKFIPDILTLNDDDDDRKSLTKLEEQISEFKEYDKRLQGDMKELKKSKENFLLDLQIKKKEILDWFNQMEVNANRNIENVYERSKRDIEQKRTHAKELRHELSAEHYFLKEILEKESYSKIYKFIKAKQADNFCEDTKSGKASRQNTESRFSMKAHETFEEVRRSVDQLYQLKVEKKGETKFSVRLREDKYVPNITGCTISPSGNFVLADQANKSVKVFTTKLTLANKIAVPEGVFDVTSVDTNTIAVTSPEKAKVIVLQVSTDPVVLKEIDVGQCSCWGIKHHGGLFVVNCSNDTKFNVRVVNSVSQILFQVETRNSLFSELFVDGDNRKMTICIASAYNDETTNDVNFVEELTHADKPEIVVLQYNYLNHLYTKGVACDSHGNLVVCCKDTHQIYTISRTGQDVELMLAEADGLKSPQAIAYTADKSKLLVTSENTDFIQIFEFSL